MNKQYSIRIKAPKTKVWDIMLNDKTYREWTAEFHAGSYYSGSWEKGSKILFMGPDDSGKLFGMVSTIAENKKYEFLSIKHLGVVLDGVEDTTSTMAKEWAGAMENYTFKEVDGTTELIIDMKISETEQEMFDTSWPKALQKLKKIVEK